MEPIGSSPRQQMAPISKPCVIFSNTLYLYGLGILAPPPNLQSRASPLVDYLRLFI
jgi:hypothetical protein